MDKLEGHTYCPLSKYFERKAVQMPKNWTAKSRLAPGKETQEQVIRERLEKLQARVTRRVPKQTKDEDGGNPELRG